MNPKQILINAITGCGFVEGKTLFLQGTLGSAAYPDSFVTFWTDYTADNTHFDNAVHSYVWSFSVIYYSNNAANTNTIPATITAALKAAGFIPQGKGRDIPSDEPTHTGWAMDFLFADNVKNFDKKEG